MPDIPGSEALSNPGTRAQHSRVEWLFWALRTVRVRVWGVVGSVGGGFVAAAVMVPRRAVRMVEVVNMFVVCIYGGGD